jgi:hypothetical protein
MWSCLDYVLDLKAIVLRAISSGTLLSARTVAKCLSIGPGMSLDGNVVEKAQITNSSRLSRMRSLD